MASMAQILCGVHDYMGHVATHLLFFMVLLPPTVNEIASKAVAAGLTDPKHVVAFTLGFTSGSRDYCCLVAPNQWVYRSFSALIIFIFLAQSTKNGCMQQTKRSPRSRNLRCIIFRSQAGEN